MLGNHVHSTFILLFLCSCFQRGFCTQSNSKQIGGGCPRGVMVYALDCGIVEREFVLQLWESYEPPYPPSYGLNSATTVLLGV